MEGIFPSYQGQEKTNTLPIPKDFAIDFTTGDPIIENDDFVIVEGDSAIKVWCYYALKISKDRFIIYSPEYPEYYTPDGEEYIDDWMHFGLDEEEQQKSSKSNEHNFIKNSSPDILHSLQASPQF